MNYQKANLPNEAPEQENRSGINIDLRGILATILYRWWIIVTVMIVAVVAAFLFSYFQKPIYASTSKLFVTGMSVNSTEQSPSQGTQSTAVSIAKSLQDMVKDRYILNEVSDELEEMGIVNPETKAKYTYAELIAAVSVTYSSDKPQILSIRAVSTDRNISREIANKVQEVAAKKLTEISMTRVNTGNTAGTGARTNDNMLRNMVIGALVGALIGVIGVLIAYFADDKIKSAEDVEKYLGLSVLGQIPITERAEDPEADAGYRKGRKKKKEGRAS